MKNVLLTSKQFFPKLKDKLWSKLVRYMRRYKRFYPFIYRSYWHYLFFKKGEQVNHNCYFAARPNPGAGIGHQMANWIAGYWFAKQFGLKFAHIPFSTKKWEDFLGFGEDETTVEKLVKAGYKTRKLPLFDEDNRTEVDLVKKIIKSYADKKIVFVAEQDQFYKDQFGVIDNIKAKFNGAKARGKDKLIYSKEHFNIAIHVRRGDIVIGQETKNPNLLMRYQSNNYFKKVLTEVLTKLNTTKPIFIYLFSQGKEEDFKEFQNFKNLHYCLDMSAQDSFLHMVYADLLITSKSSFSYKPALLSNGIKICPTNFWHGYPNSTDWILADDKTGQILNKKEITL